MSDDGKGPRNDHEGERFPLRMATVEDVQELVKHRKWKWMPGMLVAETQWGAKRYRVSDVFSHRLETFVRFDSSAPTGSWSADGYLPVHTDPATAGCMLTLVLAEAVDMECDGLSLVHDAMSPSGKALVLDFADAVVWALRASWSGKGGY